MASIRKTLAELERATGVLIKELFIKPGVTKDMPVPVVTIQRRGRKQNGDGWYVQDAWEDRGSQILNVLARSKGTAVALDELTIAAESLNARPMEVLHTLHHELVHHSCRLDDVQDFAQNGVYHTVAYRNRAEMSGLKVGTEGNRGYAITKPTAATKQVYAGIALDEGAFRMYRTEEHTADRRPARNPNKRWTCNKCGFNLRVGGKGFNGSIHSPQECGGTFLFNDKCRYCGKLFEQVQQNHYCSSCGVEP